MYAQLLMFTIEPDMRAKAEKMAGEFAAAHKSQRGFKSAVYFGDVAKGEYGSLTIWETQEDIASSAAVLRPNLEKALTGIAKEPPTVRIFEVFEPNI